MKKTTVRNKTASVIGADLSPLEKPTQRLSRRSEKDSRPVKLVAVQNSETRYLMILEQIAADLMAENHPLGDLMQQACKELIRFHHVRGELVDHDSRPKSVSAKYGRTGVTKEQLETHKAAYIKRHKTEHGWKTKACKDFGITDTRTLKKIM